MDLFFNGMGQRMELSIFGKKFYAVIAVALTAGLIATRLMNPQNGQDNKNT